MIINDEIIQTFLKCHTKFHLKTIGVAGTSSEFSDWQQYMSDEFGRKCCSQLRSNVRNGECISEASFSRFIESDTYRLGFDCTAIGEGFQSRIHALERVHSSSHNDSGIYIPIRFVPSEKITKDDRLLLAFNALVMSSTSQFPQFGKIISGTVLKTTKIRLPNLTPTILQIIDRIQAKQAGEVPSPPLLNKHCSECEYQQHCHQRAIEKDDLGLLAGMNETERKKLYGKGIFTVKQLSYTFRARRRPKRYASKPEKYSHALKALAIREQKIYVAGKPKLNLSGTPVFLDVEGIPDRDLYYLVGLRVKVGDSYTQYSLWANEQTDEEKIWASLLQILAKIGNPQVIHYGSYEKTFLKKMKKCYPEASKNFALMDDLIANSVNLLSVIYGQIYFPVYSNSLKEIARTLGFHWTESQASGVAAIAWRSKWELSKDSGLRQKLITYNAEDCEALRLITSTILTLCQKPIGDEIQTNSNIVHTDSMKPEMPYRFGTGDFALQDFKLVNRAAYWDYQRDKVYVRSSQKVRNAVKRNVQNQRKAFPIDDVLRDSSPVCCPRCTRTDFRKHDLRSRVIWNIRFDEFGIRRWIQKHIFARYFCYQCKKVFDSRQNPWTRRRYGWQLAAFATYQMIDLQIPQSSVTRSLNEIFHFNISPSVMSDLKSAVAHCYKDLYNLILSRIVGGKLIHADETWVSVQGERAFVWVLTNLEEVVYFYAETREGNKVQELLKDFKGILVSDFYGAYDSIDCPQQKCLIHLIRDLNEDLLKQPFDEELKELAQTFGLLLKPIIETIDRHGLKTCFLSEHKSSVERFYSDLLVRRFSSEIAAKYRKRFEKNRNKLFTFLDYDDIPWNNNNAEFAIKTFARLRRVIGSVSTVKGIQDYLTLLSISLTCRYKGVRFLDLMRSGEKDVDIYIEKNMHDLYAFPE